MHPGYRTVGLLALFNAIAMSGTPMMMLIGSIIGTELASSPRWATLPIALMVIGTACGVVPASRGMANWGRKWFALPNPLYGSWLRALGDDPADHLETRR